MIQTQIHDSTQTNTNMSLKCLQSNLKKIWGYVSTPTNLEELFNSPPNKMKVSSKHAKSTPNRARARLNPAHQRPLSRNPPKADAVCPTDPSGPTPHHPTPHRASHSALLSRNQSIEAVCDNVTTLIRDQILGTNNGHCALGSRGEVAAWAGSWGSHPDAVLTIRSMNS